MIYFPQCKVTVALDFRDSPTSVFMRSFRPDNVECIRRGDPSIGHNMWYNMWCMFAISLHILENKYGPAQWVCPD